MTTCEGCVFYDVYVERIDDEPAIGGCSWIPAGGFPPAFKYATRETTSMQGDEEHNCMQRVSMITSDYTSTRTPFARAISLADLEKLTAGLSKDTRIVPNGSGNLTVLNAKGHIIGWIDLHLPEHISGHAIHLGETE